MALAVILMWTLVEQSNTIDASKSLELKNHSQNSQTSFDSISPINLPQDDGYLEPIKINTRANLQSLPPILMSNDLPNQFYNKNKFLRKQLTTSVNQCISAEKPNVIMENEILSTNQYKFSIVSKNTKSITEEKENEISEECNIIDIKESNPQVKNLPESKNEYSYENRIIKDLKMENEFLQKENEDFKNIDFSMVKKQNNLVKKIESDYDLIIKNAKDLLINKNEIEHNDDSISINTNRIAKNPYIKESNYGRSYEIYSRRRANLLRHKKLKKKESKAFEFICISLVTQIII